MADFGLNIGGSIGSNLDPRDARSLGLIAALKQMQSAGLQRTASPAGSIAQNLAPIFSAMIYSKAAEANAKRQQQDQAQDTAKTKADIEYKQAQVDLMKARQKALEAGGGTGGLTKDQALAKQAMDDPNSEAAKLWKFIQQGKVDVTAATGAAGAAARQPIELDTFQKKEAIKAAELKPLPTKEADELTSGMSLIDTFDRSMAGFKNVTGKDIVTSTLTHGMYSSDALRDYNKIFNEIDNMRAGSRGMTQAALDRVRKELPPPEMALIDPKGFMRQFGTARDDWYNTLARRGQTLSGSYKVPQNVNDYIASKAPKGIALPGTEPSKVDVDSGLVEGMKANMKMLMERHYTREEAKAIIMKKYGLNPQVPDVVGQDQPSAPDGND